MTSEQEIFQLAAAVKLSGKADGILVPLYSLYPSNKYFVAVTNSKMNIEVFHELDGFFDYIVYTGVSACRKSQFVEGDLSPVMYTADDGIEIVCEDSIEELIDALEGCDQSDFHLVQEIIRDLQDGLSAADHARRDDETHLLGAKANDIRPLASRLWLDVAVEDLFTTRSRNLDDAEKKARVRLQLLAWATEVPKVATTPIFRHFIATARRAELNGVYVEDILATAIVNWIAEEIARLDKVVDLIRDFRGTYGRSPLSCVRGLLDREASKIAEWAGQTMSRYYDYVRRVLATPSTYRLLVVTFVADGGDHWPDDIKSWLLSDKAENERELKSLLEQVAETAKKRKRGGTAASRLLSLARSVQTTTARLDAVQKILSPSAGYSDPIQRFRSIDYTALGLNRDYFLNLERELAAVELDWSSV